MKRIAVVFLGLLLLCLEYDMRAADENWIATWASGQQLTEPHNLPPAPGLSNNTLRQVIHASLGGKKLKLQFSNEYGKEPLVMAAVQIAVSAGLDAIKPKTNKALLFKGAPSVTIPPGETVFSDPVNFTLAPLSNLAVTIVFGEVSPALAKQVTGHPGSRTTSFLQAGDAIAELSLPSAAKTDHWYIISRLDVVGDKKAAVIVTLGDSITDGRGSTTNGNDRWPNHLARRLQADKAFRHIAVVNMGIGGNGLFSGGLGPTARQRFDRDVLAIPGVKWVIILEGVNDLGGSGKLKAEEMAAQTIAVYEEMIAKARAKKVKVYGVPILPFGDNDYDRYEHEKARQLINEWIRAEGHFDGVIDLDAAVRDPAEPNKLLDEYHMGDHLHPSQAGHQKLGESVDLKLFK